MANVAQQINIGPMDLALAVTAELPAGGANITVGVLDLQAVGPNSDAWRMGRFAVIVPAIPGNAGGAGITVAMWVAPPSLVAGSAAVAPLTPPPGAFVSSGQTVTIAAVAGTGSVSGEYYFAPAFDANGSTYQFYQFVITSPAQVNSLSEIVTVGWVYA